MKLFLDISGWAGSLMILLSYALTLYKTKDFSFFGKYLNLIGGFLVAINCLYYNAMPSFVTNIVWTFIAIISIFRAKKHFPKNSLTFKK
jgi:hypothetical protein|nr:hypothetical protein [uncultured Allomuricauda sp.]